MKIAVMTEVQLSGQMKQVEDMKLQAVTKREGPGANLCQWCFRIHLSYCSKYLTAVSFISWTLKAFGNFTDCKNKLSNHVVPHHSIHWFFSRCALRVQQSPKTFGKVEAVAEVKKHRYSWTEAAERFLQPFHTLCLLPSQYHLPLPHSCVDRQLGIALFHLFFLTYTNN